jgi:hypothetical protein
MRGAEWLLCSESSYSNIAALSREILRPARGVGNYLRPERLLMPRDHCFSPSLLAPVPHNASAGNNSILKLWVVFCLSPATGYIATASFS